PVFVITVAAVVGSWREGPLWFWPSRVAVALLAAGFGAIPWLWANVGTGFKSIQSSSFSGHHTVVSHEFGARFSHFFQHGLQVLQGTALDGHNPIGSPIGSLLILCGEALIVVAVVACFVTPGRSRAIGLAVVAFPFVYAASPASWYWFDGRYAMYFP